jgi:hypothetical protein
LITLLAGWLIMAEIVASVPSNIISFGLAIPDQALDPFGEVIGVSNDAPVDSQFLTFEGEVEPTDYTIHEPFGKRRGVGHDGGLRYISLENVTLFWKAIGITRRADGSLPSVTTPESAPTLKGIYRLIIRALTEREGFIWLNWQRQVYRTPIPNPETFSSTLMWYKDICRVRRPVWLAREGFDGTVAKGFAIEFCQFGLSGEDTSYKGGTPIPPPGAGTGNPATAPVRWAGGFGIGSFGSGGFGVGTLT